MKINTTLTSTCLLPIINLEPSATLFGLIVFLPIILPSKSYNIYKKHLINNSYNHLMIY